VAGGVRLAELERTLADAGLTLDVDPLPATTVAEWLAAGAPGAPDPWRDPADHLVAGLDAVLGHGKGGRRSFVVRPAPRRAVGPDLAALLLGAKGRFGHITRAWLRVHPSRVPRPRTAPFAHDRDPAPNSGERELLDAIAASLGGGPVPHPGGHAMGRPPMTWQCK
jgi:alkyldihydroxyacetonephosphate synthase